jgi:hypothetical protein
VNRLLLILPIAFLCCGCFERKPNIPDHHWRGGALYDENGIEVATVTVFPFGIDSSQACVFLTAGLNYYGCTYWETGQQAFDQVGKVFASERRR